jgi:hypothetical protein
MKSTKNAQILKFLRQVAIVALLSLAGCTTKQTTLIESRPEVVVQKAPGVVEHVWEEPMTDVIDVPPGLDPEGHYYSPAHQEVVEIRQGRWKYYREKDE